MNKEVPQEDDLVVAFHAKALERGCGRVASRRLRLVTPRPLVLVPRLLPAGAERGEGMRATSLTPPRPLSPINLESSSPVSYTADPSVVAISALRL